MVDAAWAQRGDDIEDSDRLEEIRAAYAEKCLIACAGLPDGAIDGGWTAAGMSCYTRKLEDALNEILILPTEQIAKAYVIAGQALSFRNMNSGGSQEQDDSDRLKTCPFCGSEAEILTMPGEDENIGAGAQFVQCTNSHCLASSALIYPLGDNIEHILMERWNKRHNV